MEIPELPPTDGRSGTEAYRRREILAAGVGLGATFLAGCATQTDSAPANTDAESTDTAAQSAGSTGSFRLLISDQPTAIGDFDRLDVSLSHARVFPTDSGSDDSEATESSPETEAGKETDTEGEPEATETSEDGEGDGSAEGEEGGQDQVESETADDVDQDQTDDGEEPGFFEIELDGATVDLTEVVGERAIAVFDGELEAGRYAKLELHVTEVEGIVAGEQVDVKVPSEKLQLVKPFEVVPGETLSFVFDINVVKKGQTGEYNLLPVISESGVAGADVPVEEIDPGEVDESETDANGNETAGGPPDDAGGDA